MAKITVTDGPQDKPAGDKKDAKKKIEKEAEDPTPIVELTETDVTPDAIAKQAETAASGEVSAPEEPEKTDDEPSPDLNVATEPDPDVLTDKAVDDIGEKDSDTVLEHEDAELAKAFEPEEPKSFGQRIKGFFAAWWHNPKARWTTILVLLAGISTVAALPQSRYYVLNIAGVRVSSSLSVLDDQTQLPLKNVQVSLAGKTAITDASGHVVFSNLRLGPSDMVVHKRAFADTQKTITLGLGSNPLGSFTIKATGSQYLFKVTDWLSGKPISKVQVESGEGNAVSDKDGRIRLVLDQPGEAANIPVKVTLDGYRSEEFVISADAKTEQSVKLVPSAKHLFVSKRSGKYDLYKIDADGKNEKVLLTGTGNERDDIALLTHAADDVTALVSTRSGEHNDQGYELSDLNLVDVESGERTKLASSERIQMVDWIGDRLVYVAVAEGASGSNPKRHRLISYDYKTGSKTELASSNYFNDVVSAGGRIYYAPSNAFLLNQADAKLLAVSPDGTSKQTIIDKEVWNIFRTEYGKLSLSVGQDWYSYVLGASTTTKLTGPPPQIKTTVFAINDDKSQALWVDSRDGKGVLLTHTVAGNQDKVLETRAGLNYPVSWLNDTYAVFRVVTPQETADYVISTEGGQAMKIRDVSNTTGLDKWFFY